MPTWALVLIIGLLLLILWQLTRLVAHQVPRKPPRPSFEDLAVDAVWAACEEGVPDPYAMSLKAFGEQALKQLNESGDSEFREWLRRLVDQDRLVLPYDRFQQELWKRSAFGSAEQFIRRMTRSDIERLRPR
jgi:hypothetical protein